MTFFHVLHRSYEEQKKCFRLVYHDQISACIIHVEACFIDMLFHDLALS